MIVNCFKGKQNDLGGYINIKSKYSATALRSKAARMQVELKHSNISALSSK